MSIQIDIPLNMSAKDCAKIGVPNSVRDRLLDIKLDTGAFLPFNTTVYTKRGKPEEESISSLEQINYLKKFTDGLLPYDVLSIADKQQGRLARSLAASLAALYLTFEDSRYTPKWIKLSSRIDKAMWDEKCDLLIIDGIHSTSTAYKMDLLRELTVTPDQPIILLTSEQNPFTIKEKLDINIDGGVLLKGTSVDYTTKMVSI